MVGKVQNFIQYMFTSGYSVLGPGNTAGSKRAKVSGLTDPMVQLERQTSK